MVEKGGLHTMNIIKKESVGTAIPETDSIEINQPNITTGYETCQDIPTIKAELDRLGIEMDKNNFLARNEPDPQKSARYYRKTQDEAIRYWAIRWVMGWEKEIPNVEM
jgi:hypothetical protein